MLCCNDLAVARRWFRPRVHIAGVGGSSPSTPTKRKLGRTLDLRTRRWSAVRPTSGTRKTVITVLRNTAWRVASCRDSSTLFPSTANHKASGRAVGTIDAKDHYLGKWGSPESKAEYDRFITEWLATDVVFAAMAVFVHFDDAMNRNWNVKRRRKSGLLAGTATAKSTRCGRKRAMLLRSNVARSLRATCPWFPARNANRTASLPGKWRPA